ncbi:MAG: PHP domain-containing protein [Desulfarculaceae bacterium]|nr:PHP domain-containing protein [Desulfarculaceae bacterium]MCF8047791.1 PHP domain-containing protein [Desulfarculaceae bacterium]MCF8064927.1 PHP domain-containing protein [Desulfarculaceae bacterium]MCF8099782.1 PHP domain-containing protein [Desulfarculaceae bacterium]MCF8122974.1 PHP domain-containing protein [Desulfarculaceae bacterium]
MKLIDLHTHSTASDGTLPPAQVAQAAAEAALAAVALTDHDTTEGLAEFLAAARPGGPELVPGVELSVERPGGGSMHLVGLWMDQDEPRFKQGLERVQAAREQRNPKIASRLQGLGVDITLEEVAAVAGGGQVGRPHFAQVLVDKGVVQNPGEAFGRFLKRGAPAYMEKERLSPGEAMALIRGAGGVTVLAHPGLLQLHPAVLEQLVKELKDQGLMGIEAYYSEHNPALERRLLDMAARLGLAVSGGSDFHGHNKPGIRLGAGQGTLRVPASLLAGLKQSRDTLSG